MFNIGWRHVKLFLLRHRDVSVSSTLLYLIEVSVHGLLSIPVNPIQGPTVGITWAAHECVIELLDYLLAYLIFMYISRFSIYFASFFLILLCHNKKTLKNTFLHIFSSLIFFSLFSFPQFYPKLRLPHINPVGNELFFFFFWIYHLSGLFNK